MEVKVGCVTSLFSLLIIAIVQHPCHGCDREEVVESDETLVIKTPYFPNDYPPSINCISQLSARPGYRLRVHFTAFELEPGNAYGLCAFDFLQMFDGTTLLAPLFGTFCDDDKPPTIVSSGQDLYIVFHSDSTIQAFGFRAEVTAVPDSYREPLPSPAPGSCTTILRQSGGGFYSPGYPDSYHADETCKYIISLPNEDQYVMLRFTSFDLEPSYECVYDYVEVRDGISEVAPLIGRYCGGSRNKPPRQIESTGPDLHVVFRSDVSATFEGFYAEYASSGVGFDAGAGADEGITGGGSGKDEDEDQVSVCDFSHALMTDRGGLVVSHDTYPRGSYGTGLTCSMVFVASQLNEKIFINVLEMDLPGGSPCNADSLRIIDGDLSTLVNGRHDLATLCGTTTGQYSSSFLYGLIQFSSDGSSDGNHKGFKMVYSVYYEDAYGCQDDDFHCKNDRCIDKSLKCDGYDHCGDNSDETKGCRGDERGGNWTIALIVFGAIAVLVVACSIAFFVMKNVKKPPPSQNNNLDARTLTTLSATTAQANSSSFVSQPASYSNHAYEAPREASSISAEVQQHQPPSYSQIYEDPAYPPPSSGKPKYPTQQHTMFLASGVEGSNTQSATGRGGQLPPLMAPGAGLPSNTAQSLPPIRGTPAMKSPNYNP